MGHDRNKNAKTIKFEYKFLVAYLLIGGLWILFSDRVVKFFIFDIDYLTAIQTYKGWFFVFVSGFVFFFYLKRYLIKIRRAEQKARESESLKSAFLQNMSHEIRTPMNGIIGFMELLKDENISKEQRERFMNIVLKCSDQLLGVVNDVLDLSLIETGNVKLENDDVVLYDLMNEIYLSYAEVNQKNILFNIDINSSDKTISIVTDVIKLKQVLDNLLSNAFKFTDKGKIEFGYKKNNESILFFVKDTGAGIKPEQLMRIFNRFERSEVETTKLMGGAGLGLAICKGIVNEMKGQIWAESELGFGAQFYFEIPFVPSVNHQIIVTDTNNIISDVNKDCLLIVEDEDSNYLYLLEILERLDIKIWRAKNGIEAVDLYLKHNQINMILMDIKMPVLDGYEATKRIREFDSCVPIIAQTAFALGNEKKQAFEAGCTDYIAKPFKREEIYSLIRKYQMKSN